MKKHISSLLSLSLMLTFLLSTFTLSAQLVLKEGSLKERPNDTEILVNRNTPAEKALITDDNGYLCALIKISVENMIKADRDLFRLSSNREADRGTFVMKVETDHPNEIWIFLSPEPSYLVLKNDRYGNCKFDFRSMGLSLKSGKVYEATIVGDRKVYESILAQEVAKGNEIEGVKTGWLILKSEPEAAVVYIDGLYAGETPFTKKLPYGEHAYRLEKPLYHDAAGDVAVNAARVEKTLTLLPAHGFAKITTLPEKGATILIDGKEEGQSSDALSGMLSPGEHEIMVRLNMYQPATQQVTITEGETTSVSFTMQPRFANVTLRSDEGTRIFLNGSQRATGSFQGRLMEGLYDVDVQKEHYRFTKRQIEVLVGRDTVMQLDMRPIYGSLDVVTTPMEAAVFINGKSYGQTPISIDKLLEGSYTVELRKEGYGSEQRTVNIADNQNTAVNVTLSSGKRITIQTDGNGDAIKVDGQSAGLSPLTVNLSYGSHTIVAERAGKQVSQQVVVSQQSSPALKLGFLAESLKWSSSATAEQKQILTKLAENMVAVKGGTFNMGATSEQGSDAESDESPAHSVTLSDFYIGKYEVTQAEWVAVMGENPSNWKGDNLPVEQVSWNDIQTFLTKLNRLTGKNFTLPTEAQWEYAARGGDKSKVYKYSGSNTIIANVAWYDGNSGSKTHSVGTKQPNELGIYDMSGNVWEWCQDWYGSYNSASQTNPAGPSSGYYRVLRGGSWRNYARHCRVSSRGINDPAGRYYNYFGFRLALLP